MNCSEIYSEMVPRGWVPEAGTAVEGIGREDGRETAGVVQGASCQCPCRSVDIKAHYMPKARGELSDDCAAKYLLTEALPEGNYAGYKEEVIRATLASMYSGSYPVILTSNILSAHHVDSS